MIFDEKKAFQAAAYFLACAEIPLPALKLSTLLYLAERRSFGLYSEPMTGDILVSMQHGPALSAAHELINVISPSFREADADLPDLSDADIDILAQTWSTFGAMPQREILNYARTHCCEWRDPGETTRVITYETLFDALEFSAARKAEAIELLEERQGLERAFKQDFA